ncbi:Fic family protein, partial [bacterium]|nr:Fic family protein [bacterium]
MNHFDLKIVSPPYDSPLTDIILELEQLRKKFVFGSTKPSIFFQFKKIFHLLESLASARIEGNYTTVFEFVETKINDEMPRDEHLKEIVNLEKALDFIDENSDCPIDRIFVAKLHQMVVAECVAEGDPTPGIYRQINVKIARSPHIPPDYLQVSGYMDELLGFINQEVAPKYGLLKIAIAHHRFAWIHPFNNGNGRTARLLIYAMLLKQRFNVGKAGRILNPTAVFCNNREKYYDYLSVADGGDEQGIMQWCEYVLDGLRNEIHKIDRLLDYEYLKKEILLPALKIAVDQNTITYEEEKILEIAVRKQEFQSRDLQKLFAEKLPQHISRIIRNLKNKKMVMPVEGSKRKYVIIFDCNPLLRGIIRKLGEKGFIPFE